METIYFLIFIGACAFAVIWVTRRPKSKTKLAGRRSSTKTMWSDNSLATPASNCLANKEEIWEKRRKQAGKGFSAPKQFVPKFEAAKEAQYDGYSRRDRHHLTAKELVKEEAHIEGHGEFSISSVDFDSKEHASQT